MWIVKGVFDLRFYYMIFEILEKNTILVFLHWFFITNVLQQYL